MNYITTYLEKMTKQTFYSSLIEYRQYLDKKLRGIEMYIKYLFERKTYVARLIDHLTLSLENKYIDILDESDIE
ncbi:hypothetical protein BUY32_10085, partial [Staphylococcus cohnii]